MAKKSKKLTRKQLKQQRQEAIARRRREKGWVPPQARAKPARQELLDDALPLFPLANQVESSKIAVDALFENLMDSEDLADEPEFEDMFFDPMECVVMFIKIGEERGIDPSEFSSMPENEVNDIRAELAEEVARRLFSKKIHREILDRLEKLRLRLKESGPKADVPRVAALQLFLDSPETRELWPLVGLIYALVVRSLEIGFELMGVQMQVAEFKKGMSPQELFETVARSGLVKKLQPVVKKFPALMRYMEKQVDTVWDDGIKALFEGELYLELYTREELEQAAKIFTNILEENTDEETSARRKSRLPLNQQKGKIIFSQIQEYITNLFLSTEQFERLKTRLHKLASDPTFPEKWDSFRLMLVDITNKKEATVEDALEFLIPALLGEMRKTEIILDK